MGKGDSASGESDDANDNENNPDDGDRLHENRDLPEHVHRMLIDDDLDAPAGAFYTDLPAARRRSNLLLHGKGG